MNKIISPEKTTQDAVRHLPLQNHIRIPNRTTYCTEAVGCSVGNTIYKVS